MAAQSRTLPSFAIGLAAGLVAGAGAMLVAFPYLFPPPAANDAAPEIESAAPGTAASLPFRFDPSAPGRDAIHWADGTGRIVRTAQGWVLRLESDFRAGPGPNYWIYLNTVPVGEERDFEADAGRHRLVALRAFEGAQNYLLPAGLDPARFRTVTVWCETFGAYIGSAPIGPAAP